MGRTVFVSKAPPLDSGTPERNQARAHFKKELGGRTAATTGRAIDIAPFNIAMQHPAVLQGAVAFELLPVNLASVRQTIGLHRVSLALLLYPLR